MIRNILLLLSSTFIFAIVFNGCNILDGLGGATNDADLAYYDGQYEDAFKLYNDYIETRTQRGRNIEPGIYEKAGISAYKLDKTSKSIEYLNLAGQSSALSAEGLMALAKSYQKVDNLTLEIRNLEAFIKSYPDEPEFNRMQVRYFETLVEGRNWEEAHDLWDDLQIEASKDEALLEKYLIVNRSLDKDNSATELAKEILSINENNIAALDWLAKKYYYQALERYNSEMKAYEQNRTHRQYAQLREAWPIIHQDYRASRDYFLRLYAIEAKAEYARFLANIYERLNDDVNARYYRQRAD